jgi:UDP-glucose 4-epimerase
VSAGRVLVTGGAGFIGSHVVQALVDRGIPVIATDMREGGHRRLEGVEWFTVDLRDGDAVHRVMHPEVDAVVHLAAATSVLRSVERPAETFATNVTVTANLLERARQLEVETFVFASTNAVVGAAERLPLDEHSRLVPLTPYGATKAAAEMVLSSYGSAFGMRCPALRLSNVYGPGMGGKDTVVPRLLNATRSGTTFEVYGDGSQMRDYVYIDDVIAAVLMAMSAEVTGPIVIGSGTSTTVLQLVEMVRELTGAPLPVRHVSPKQGEMARVLVDNALARSLGWSPTVRLEEGLGRVWSSWHEKPETAGAGSLLAGSPVASG